MVQDISQKNSIFISYNRRDLESVKTLTQDLEELGNSVWFDQAITGGQNWWDHILHNIREHEIFIFALTPDSLESEACMEEMNYAHKLGKSVLPVLLSDKVNVSLLPSSLNEIQYVDYRQQDKNAIKYLVKAIKNLPSPDPLPDPLPSPPHVPVSYLSVLKEKIVTTESLSFEEQAVIVLNMKKRLGESHSPEELEELRDLLRRLRQRDDLLAKTADEIDTITDKVKEKTYATGQNQKNIQRTDTTAGTVKSWSEKFVEKVKKAQPIEFDHLTKGADKPSSRTVKVTPEAGKMIQYKIFEHSSGKIEIVKQGWSWPAFFFTGWWALFKKMWVLGGCMLFLSFIMFGVNSNTLAVGDDQTPNVLGFFNLIIWAVFGMKGNSWRESNLLSKGYTFKTTLTATNPESAMALYIKEKLTR